MTQRRLVHAVIIGAVRLTSRHLPAIHQPTVRTRTSMGTRRALGVTSASQLISFALNLLNVIVVARLLTPSEIGVFSVAVSFQAIVHVFREFGVNQYLVQATSVAEDDFRAAFTLTLMFSWTVALFLFVGSGPLSVFYNHDGVATVLALLAVNFLLMPFGTPSLGMLVRELRFERLAAIRIANLSTATIVTITAAWLGQSYLSMVWGAIAGQIANLVAVSIARPQGILMLPTLKGVRSIFRFGSISSAATLIQELGRSAPDLILGRTLGFSAVAYYSRAAGLRDMLLGQLVAVVNGVHFPTFAQAIRDGADPAELYTRATTYLIGVTIPFLALLALLAEPLILFFFGDQWLVSAPLATLLCLFAIFTAPYALARLSLIASGQVSSVLYLECVVQAIRIAVLLTSIWLPLERVVPLLGIVAAIEAAAYQYGLRRYLGVGFAQLWKSIATASVLSLLTLLGPGLLWLSPIADADSMSMRFSLLALSGLTALGAWVAGLFLLKHPLREELVNVISTAVRFVRR